MTGKRFFSLFRRRRLDRELDEEIAIHLAMQEDEFLRRGMTPAAARAAARREFGGVAQAKEDYRDRRGGAWVDAIAQDVRYALRGLRRAPGFTAAAVISLGLGIGANTAIFSLFHTLMLQMLPVANPRELVYLFQSGAGDAGFVSPSLYVELGKRTDLFSGVLARRGAGTIRLRQAGGTEPARSEAVAANYFRVLGVTPALGRFFSGEETGTAVLSYDYWRNRCNSDPGILGRTLSTETRTLTVIGVAAPSFHGVEVESRADLWTSLPVRATDNARYFWVMARRRPGVSVVQLQSALDVLMEQHQLAAYGKLPPSNSKRKLLQERIDVRDGAIGISFLRAEFGKGLRVLLAAVGLVLLATCANVAHLLLARGAARHREIAVRHSLGATRARLIRQALTESLLLAAFGSLLGLAAAYWGGRYLLLFLPAWKAGTLNLVPNGTVLAFAIAISILSALVFGVAPAFRSTAIDAAAGLRVSQAGNRGRPVLRRAIGAAQVAMSVVLVVLAGLFAHSLSELRRVDLGFSENLITFWLEFPGKWKDADVTAARNRLVAGAAALPGVRSVSYSAPDVLQGGSLKVQISVPGSNVTARETAQVAMADVGPQFFETLGATILAGRDISTGDTATSRKVAIVNQAFVRHYLHGDPQPLGRVFQMKSGDAPEQLTIVGVVHDAAHQGVRKTPAPMIYAPVAQMDPPMDPSIVVRGTLPAAVLIPAIRAELGKLGSDVSLVEPKTVRQRIDEFIFQDRMLATLSGFFGALALLLAAVGLYGVVAYTTALRSAEIGIRVALGAQRVSVLWLVMRDALALVACGLLVGLPLALAAARGVSSVLFGIGPADLTAFTWTAAVLLAAGVGAALLPARRAAAMDPMRALRHE